MFELNYYNQQAKQSYSDDLIQNPSTRCACILVIDTSSSMSGSPINELNKGITAFIEAVKNDDVAACSVDLAIISAGDTVSVQQPFTTVINIPDGASSNVTAYGLTPIGEAVDTALNMLEGRKNEYKRNGIAYYQPWLVIISDGAPTDAWQGPAQRAKNLSDQRKLVSLPIGVAGADMNILNAFTAKQAVPLNGLNFKAFFEWLSASMSRVSASNSTTAAINLSPINSWASI